MPVHVGTSGWQYDHWKRLFYPPRTPDQLAFYARSFSTVEVNGSFYRLPEKKTFAGWAQRTPDAFIFSVKASRYLTHILRLRQPRRPVRRLLTRVEALGGKLGPILLQLPPAMAPDLQRLGETLAAYGAHRVAVEFRDPRW